MSAEPSSGGPLAHLREGATTAAVAVHHTVGSAVTTVTGAVHDFEQQKKHELTELIHRKVDSAFDHTMARLCSKVKRDLKDPYMPGIVYSFLSSLVDAIWPDVQHEVKDVALSRMQKKKRIDHGSPCCCWSPRSFLRYHLMPYDRNFWRCLRDPTWWVFRIVSCIPRYGAPQIVFTIYFFTIDLMDEYQLLNFILAFKALQFLNLGILSSIVGAVQYYICTARDSCASGGAPSEQVFTMALFVWQIVLVWIAFILMPCAKRKGGQYYQLVRTAVDDSPEYTTLKEAIFTDTFARLTEEQDAQASARVRSRLRNFLLYDLVIFLICCLFAAGLYKFNALNTDANGDRNNHITDQIMHDDNFIFTSGLYWVKAFYGLMSFPFALLLLPGLSSVLSHARATAYNPFGVTVPYLGKEETDPVPWKVGGPSSVAPLLNAEDARV